MPRDLPVDVQAAISAQRSTYAYLFRIETSGGSTEIATTPFDIDVDVGDGVETWAGVGGALFFSAIEETTDPSGQGVELTLSGVDQSIIALVLTNNFRGRYVTIYLIMLDDETGTVIEDPLNLGRFLQLSDYVITETRSRDENTCTVKTRVQSRQAVFEIATPIRANAISHNDALKRAGLTVGDTFFQNTEAIAGRLIIWGDVIIGDPTPIFETLRGRLPWS